MSMSSSSTVCWSNLGEILKFHSSSSWGEKVLGEGSWLLKGILEEEMVFAHEF
jgi:hypothetical protein